METGVIGPRQSDFKTRSQETGHRAAKGLRECTSEHLSFICGIKGCVGGREAWQEEDLESLCDIRKQS